MLSNKILYSLPKTQPTLSSSHKKHTKSANSLNFYKTPNSLEVSQFIIEKADEKYVHNMIIDYGKLQKPKKVEMAKLMSHQLKLSDKLIEILQAKKTKILQEADSNRVNQSNKSSPFTTLMNQKKLQLTEKVSKSNNPESGTKEKRTKRQKKIKVTAYDFLNQMHEKAQKDISMNESNQQVRNSRKISHSRIIKTINPTSGMQTKIITYPDISQILKMKEQKSKDIESGIKKWIK